MNTDNNRDNQTPTAPDHIEDDATSTPATFSATLSETDAWGRWRTVTIEWMAQEVSGMDANMDALGVVRWLWGTPDDCPVALHRTHQGQVVLQAHPRTINATWSHTYTPTRIDADAELREGTWKVVTDDTTPPRH